MRTVAVIPARYASTRFEGKPLALIAGRSMIERVYTSVNRSPSVNEVVVATDDRRIAQAVEAFRGRAVMTSDQHRSGTDRVNEVAGQMGLAAEDIVINVQGDQPMVQSACFDQVVQPLQDDPDLGMSTLAIRIRNEREYRDPKDCKVTIDLKGYALYFSRAAIPMLRDPGEPQAEKVISYKHLGIYAYRRWFLDLFSRLPSGPLEMAEKLEQLRALEHGYPVKVVLTQFDSPEVDLPQDIPRIERLLSGHHHP